MTKNTQQSAYTLPDSAISKMRDLIRQNEGPVPHPYLDSKGIITIGVGFNVDNKADFLKLNLRKKGENGQDGPLMTEQEKRDAYDAMSKARTDRNGDFSPGAKYYKDVAKAYLSDADVNARLDQEIADRASKIREKIGAEAWDKLTDGQKATIAAVHFNVGSLDGSPKLVEAAKKGDAAGIARESHVVANKVTNGKGEVTKHERNWGAVMRNHCGALGLDADSDACWRSVAAEYKDRPEDQRKLEDYPQQMQRIFDEKPKPDDKEPPPPLTEPPAQPERQSSLGADGAAFVERAAKSVGRVGLDAALKDPAHWTKDESDAVIQDAMRYPRPYEMNQWLRERVTDHFRAIYGEDGKTLANPQVQNAGKALAELANKLAPAFDADGMATATKSMQQGLNLMNGEAMPKLKTDGEWGPITDFTFKKSVAGKGAGKIEEGFALGRLQTLAGKQQTAQTLANQTQAILGPLYGSAANGQASEPHHALALQAGLNEIGKKYDDRFAPLKLDGEIGPKTTDAFNKTASAAGPLAFAKRFGEWIGWGG